MDIAKFLRIAFCFKNLFKINVLNVLDVNPKMLSSIYFGIVESYFSYSSLVWTQNPGSIERFIILQQKSLILYQETATQVSYLRKMSF